MKSLITLLILTGASFATAYHLGHRPAAQDSIDPLYQRIAIASGVVFGGGALIAAVCLRKEPAPTIGEYTPQR